MIDATIEGPRSVSSPLGLLTNDEDLEYPIDSDVQIFLRPDDLIHDDDSSIRRRSSVSTFGVLITCMR